MEGEREESDIGCSEREKNQEKNGEEKKSGAGPRSAVWSKMEKMGEEEKWRKKNRSPPVRVPREKQKKKKNPASNGGPVQSFFK